MKKKFRTLDYKELRQHLDPAHIEFVTTAKIKPLSEFIGQHRAFAALNFGVNIHHPGYNLYAMGPAGIGKLSLVDIIIKEHAAKMPTPPDWCYVHNFETPEKPIAIELPAGMGNVFMQDMKTLVDGMLNNILIVFESDEYRIGMKRINEAFKVKRTRRRKRKNALAKDKIPNLYKERHDQEKNLQLKLIKISIEPLINKLKRKYNKFKDIISYLSSVQTDITEHADEYIRRDERTNLLTYYFDHPNLVKYRVNVLVDNSQLKGAPIILEENPVYSNLICRIEHISQQGVLSTNFSLIREGALHRANGGFLLIEARKIKKLTEAWEALKTALYTRKIKIDPIQHSSQSARPISLEPMPIPLNIKVILLGDRNTYYNLVQNDPDFEELFKVPVDFDEQIERSPKNIQLYARLIATIAKRDCKRPFHASAVAAIIDQSTRLAEDIEKLTTHIREIEDLIIQADYWAGFHHKKIVEACDVKYAVDAQIQRMDRSKELYHEDIQRDFIIIKSNGASIGQVNCLSVRRVGNYSYGHPTRVTARVRMGQGKLIDIQREIKMAGAMHSKAGLIISNFLASRFSPDHLYSISASISFEQVYCWTDGDSASVGELCALLSALAKVPIQQSLAITGSSDQYGEVQTIGGVNEKIEGFFDVCVKRGLTGKQGIIIPAVNTKNLMLREDVVAAAKAKQFFIYPITKVDEAVELLMNKPAGKRGADGHYEKDTVYHHIEARLLEYAKRRKKK